MGNTVVIGAQWGDEGKGKVVDRLADEADVVVRFGGGANAGHTLMINGRKVITHILPSGIMHSGKVNIIGPLVMVDMEVLIEELALAEECGSIVSLDRYAPIVLPIHKALDLGRELAAGKKSIGTTLRGMGPVSSDYWARFCLRLGDLVSEDRIRQVLTNRGFFAEKELLIKHYGVDKDVLAQHGREDWVLSLDETIQWAAQFGQAIKPHLADSRNLIQGLWSQKRVPEILFEGAQGVMLDLINGTAPYQTSSMCGVSAVSASLGIHKFSRVIGITKAYCTRVGEGPFPSEMDDKVGDAVRKKGNEFGATTGRLRRCGWLDLAALRYACRMGGITELAVTKLDILSGFETFKSVCDYARPLSKEKSQKELARLKLRGRGQVSVKIERGTTLTTEIMEQTEPVMDTHLGWDEDISTCRDFADLPEDAQEYIEHIEKVAGRRVTYIGVGPDREELIIR